MDLKKITNSVLTIAKEAGYYIRSQKNSIKQIQTKGIHNYVTEVDKNSEQFLTEQLTRLLDDSGFIAEEGTNNKKSDTYNWIIDPLDGTTNFIHGLMPVAVSIALMYKEELLVGVIYEIGADETFWAYKNGGAYLNKDKIQVTNTHKLDDTLLATGFPFYDYKLLDKYMELLKHFMQTSHGLRRLGSAATDLAYVACGRFDGFFEYSLNAWDVAAGALIVKEAGGKVVDFRGEDNWLFGKEIIASNSLVFNEFVYTVKKFMYE